MTVVSQTADGVPPEEGLKWVFLRSGNIGDFCVAGIAVCAIILILTFSDGMSSALQSITAVSKDLCVALAGIAAAMLGFLITTISIVVVLVGSQKLETIWKDKAQQRLERLWTTFFRAAAWLAALLWASLFYLICNSAWLVLVETFLVLVCTSSVAKSVLLLKELISGLTKPPMPYVAPPPAPVSSPMPGAPGSEVPS